MKALALDVITNLKDSFNNEKKGFSGRKLTAFFLVACIGYLHYKYVDPSNVTEFLLYDLIAVFLLLGVITTEQIIKFLNAKNGKDEGSDDNNNKQENGA